MYGAMKRALFRLEPERAHHVAMAYLRRANRRQALLGPLRHVPPPGLAREVLGMHFASPIGMAAGFDKEAVAYNALLGSGFGHVEIGTVTKQPQQGNPKPRIWRAPEAQALVNAMGFPGPGFDVICKRLAATPPRGPVGLNIGPNKDAGREESLAALSTMARDAPADYVALNVSSPNTPGLRDLQSPEALAKLIPALREAMDDGTAGGVQKQGADRPLLLKVHPDDTDEALLAVARAAVDAGAAGIIATNTTKRRPVGIDPELPGGLSGGPLRQPALAAVRLLHEGLGRDVPIIGVGGISKGRHVQDMLDAGASLVQVYTGYIYRGPRMAALLHKELA